MVLKKSKYDYNKGNTFCHLCRNKNAKETGKIYKFIFSNGRDDDKLIEVNNSLEHYLPDGEMQVNRNYSVDREVYSLNKRKRWTLPGRIIEAIDSGELEDLEFRLVMHERSRVPFRYGTIYSLDAEVKASTLSYHDSKYTVHHMYPKSKVSSLTDLKLNCHQTDKVSTPGARTTPQRPHKCHTRGIQRMVTRPDPEYCWRRRDYYFRQVMEGDYHHVNVPEIRYEIHYPDVFNRYCKCPQTRGHGSGYNIKRRGEEVKKRWKTKGGRSKPWAQAYYKGIDNIEKRQILSGYTKESGVFVDSGDELNTTYEEMPQNDEGFVRERRPLTFGDLFFIATKHSKQSLLSKCNDSRGKYHNRQTDYKTLIDSHTNRDERKSNIVYIEAPVEVEKEQCNINKNIDQPVNDKEDEVSGHENDVTFHSWNDLDLESQYCCCVIDKESVQDMMSTFSEFDVQLSDSIPQQICVTIRTGVQNALVMLWQRCGWSTSDRSEYWIKVQFECDGTVSEMPAEDLNSKLTQVDASTLSLNQITEIAKEALTNLTLDHNRTMEDCHVLPTGHLTSTISDARFHVKSVQQAYDTLLSDDISHQDDIMKSFELVEMPPISSQPSVCETCLCESHSPQADGFILLTCQHYFCIECWRLHIITRIKEGANDIPCQAFKCREYIDQILVRILVSCDLFNQWMSRKKERLLESSQLWHWCPSPSCHKVAKVISTGTRFTDDNVPVLCDCDRTWCFGCQKDIHWPATCEQYSTYRKQLAKNNHIDGEMGTTNTRIYYVDVKKCPRCKHPIEKNGGCPHMVCRCSHNFCWMCLRDGASHVDGVECRTNSTSLITMSLYDTRFLQMHKRFYDKCVTHRFKWKRTFSTRVIEQRVKNFENSISYRIKNSKKNHMEVTGLPTGRDIRSYFVFLREVHVLLENVYVMMSHTTRRMQRYDGILDQIGFCTTRMEHILNKSSLCNDDIRRAARLRISIEQSLRTLPYLASIIQHALQTAKTAMTDKPKSGLYLM
ncbi:uncharacterized protein [Argopecten irradians]|uniref:uncharacterized protein n=1 Tax=Argopecten irradians TaxID=31199 RepID=UPI00371DF0C0